MSKSLSKSKTFWVNALVMAGAAIAGMLGCDVIQEYPQLMAIFAAAVGGINIALRLVTSKPIS